MTIDYYDSNSLHYFSSTKDLDLSQMYAEFIRHLPEQAYILDAGSGSGRDSKYFLDRGFKVFAMDGSLKLAQMASGYIGQSVHHMTFDDIHFHEEFDGIWACASLLHVPRAEMINIFSKFQNALKTDGIWYVSYKWGTVDREIEGRLFTDYDDITFQQLVNLFPSLEIVKWWKTEDLRKRENDWLNAIIRKNK